MNSSSGPQGYRRPHTFTYDACSVSANRSPNLHCRFSYATTVPRLLRDLFDEMGQPLPAAFESLFSPDAAASRSTASVKSDNPSVITDSVYNFVRPSSDRSLRCIFLP